MPDKNDGRRMPGDESKALLFDKLMAFLRQCAAIMSQTRKKVGLHIDFLVRL
jgi:hypothetical protein